MTSSIILHAEDGIRGIAVTGVQTCALPISDNLGPGGNGKLVKPAGRRDRLLQRDVAGGQAVDAGAADVAVDRSEERRVGIVCRSRWSPYHLNKILLLSLLLPASRPIFAHPD